MSNFKQEDTNETAEILGNEGTPEEHGYRTRENAIAEMKEKMGGPEDKADRKDRGNEG